MVEILLRHSGPILSARGQHHFLPPVSFYGLIFFEWRGRFDENSRSSVCADTHHNTANRKSMNDKKSCIYLENSFIENCSFSSADPGVTERLGGALGCCPPTPFRNASHPN